MNLMACGVRSCRKRRKLRAQIQYVKRMGEEPDEWQHFRIFRPVRAGNVGESADDARCVIACKMLDGVRTVKPRMVARGVQDPDLEDGIADTSGYVSLRSPRLQVLSPSVLSKNGNYRAWTSSTPVSRRLASPGTFLRTSPPKEGTIQRMPFLGIKCSSVRFGRCPYGFPRVSAENPC